MPLISELARFGQAQPVHSLGMRVNPPSILQSSALGPKGMLTNTKLFGLSESIVPPLIQRSAFTSPSQTSLVQSRPLYNRGLLTSGSQVTGLIVNKRI